MKWVRGGHWYAERRFSPDGRFDFTAGDDGRLAVLAPLRSGLTDRLYPIFTPPPEYDRSDWWDEVGAPAGLVPYDLTPELANEILLSIGARLRSVPFAPFDAVSAEVDDVLCELLERWGPLEAVLGIVPEPFGSSLSDLRTVPLRSFHRQLETLVLDYADAGSTVGDRNELSERLAEHSHQALQDVEVFLRFTPDGVEFDPQPRTLRAYLWKHVIGFWGRSPHRLCKLCGLRFEVPYGPGKPPIYCPEHRNAASRKRAERLASGRRSSASDTIKEQ